MEFIIIGIVALVALGAIAALASRGDDEPPIVVGEGCAGCDGQKEGCKLAELKQKKNQCC